MYTIDISIIYIYNVIYDIIGRTVIHMHNVLNILDIMCHMYNCA